MASSSLKLHLAIISAKGLNVVNLLSKMDVYAEVTLSGDPRSRRRTPTDENGHKAPSWNAKFEFSIPSNVDHSTLLIHVVLRAEKALGDRVIGEVHIPLKDLESEPKSFQSTQFVSYQVCKPGGKPKGVLNISYSFSESPSPPGASHHETAYPVAPSTSASQPYPAQPYPPPAAASGYPPPTQGYGSYPPMGYPPPHNGGYNPQGYPPPPPVGYPYGAPPPMVQPPQRPPKKNKFGLGLGAGLLGGALGGMLIGDAIGDAAGEASAYDAGYDAGFDDAAGFDGGFDF